MVEENFQSTYMISGRVNVKSAEFLFEDENNSGVI